MNFISYLAEYFLIINHYSGGALEASTDYIGQIVVDDQHGNDNQLWFWDGVEGDVLRNKMFPDKVNM